MQLGADQLPSGSLAMTRPDPAFPEKTKPALTMVKTANPGSRAKISTQSLVTQVSDLTFGSQEDSFGNGIECGLGMSWVGCFRPRKA